MTEVQHREKNVDIEMPHANLSRPLFFLGIIAAIAAIVLFQFAIREVTLAGYDVTEASYVLALVSVPVILFSVGWSYRAFVSAITLGSIGLTVAFVAVGMFSYFYPNQASAFDTSSSNQAPLVTIVYLVGLLLILVGIYAGSTLRDQRLRSVVEYLRAVPEAETIAVPTPVPVPVAGPPVLMGQTLPISSIEGVRRAEAKRLRDAGVHNTGQILARDPAELGRAARVDEIRVRAWQSMADLVRVDGVGPHFAGALYRSGIVSVSQLADETPDSLVRRIEQSHTARRRMHAKIDEGRARAWIEDARRLVKGMPAQPSAVTTANVPTVAATAQ